MVQRQTPITQEQRTKMLAELHRDVATRNSGYRIKALKLFPHICGSCSREFSGGRMKELTVHHKDHDHNNNPPDGSNWELLCIYCHDHEHEKLLDAKYCNSGAPSKTQETSKMANPFENLDSLINEK
ncbi:MAG: YajD family HNH nuclease [Kiritimatiellae bacterium]|nr:YajD family HNH nuclease [Kiritimatiellia bacterium]